jgi:hypothetical protein
MGGFRLCAGAVAVLGGSGRWWKPPDPGEAGRIETSPHRGSRDSPA